MQRVDSEDRDRARIRFNEGRNDPDERALATPVRPEQTDHFAFVDRQFDPRDRGFRLLLFGKGLGNPTGFQGSYSHDSYSPVGRKDNERKTRDRTRSESRGSWGSAVWCYLMDRGSPSRA